MKATSPHVVLAAVLALLMFITQAGAQPAPAGMLQIVIVEGEGAINNVRSRVNREPIVRVEDENHKPVAGAAVIFFLPNQGPGGTFTNGTSSLTTTTDARGRATARGIQYNQQAGPMQIRVAASYAGQTASAVINESNVVGAVSSGGGGGRGHRTKPHRESFDYRRRGGRGRRGWNHRNPRRIVLVFADAIDTHGDHFGGHTDRRSTPVVKPVNRGCEELWPGELWI